MTRLRLAYLVPEPLEPGSGVGRKIIDQVTVWQRSGVDVSLFVLRSAETAQDSWSGAGFEVVSAAFRSRAAAVGTELARQRSRARLAGMVASWQPDVVYARWSPWWVGAGRLFRKFPVVVEINSDDVAEYRLGSKLLRSYNRATRHRLFRAAAGFVYPTHELARAPHMAGRDGFPSVVVANGIDLSIWPSVAAPANDRPRLVMATGSPGPWQGIDKFVRLATLLPGLDFHLLGPAPESMPRMPANVRLHGYVGGDEYRAILGGADVGVGPLALHRKAMDEACPLKVREYLATGLPVVMACADPDISPGAEHCLRLPNTEDNAERCAGEVQAFAERWMGRRVERQQISMLDQVVKEEARLSFLGAHVRRWRG